VVLISLSNLQVIIGFGHSEFITSQSMFFPTNMVLKRYWLSNIQKTSAIQQWAGVHPGGLFVMTDPFVMKVGYSALKPIKYQMLSLQVSKANGLEQETACISL